MTSPILDQLRNARIRNAAKRRSHRPCKTHQLPRVVCPVCSRMLCLYCHQECPHCRTNLFTLASLVPVPTPLPVAKPIPPTIKPLPKARLQGVVLPDSPHPVLRAMVPLLRPIGLRALLPHPDSRGFMAVYPFRCSECESASELAELMWRVLRDAHIPVEPTPFGSGRLFHPDRRFVTFDLRRITKRESLRPEQDHTPTGDEV